MYGNFDNYEFLREVQAIERDMRIREVNQRRQAREAKPNQPEDSLISRVGRFFHRSNGKSVHVRPALDLTC